MDLRGLLERAVAAGATDVHVKVGSPPRVRREGRLEPVSEERVTEDDVAAVLEEVCSASPARLEGFEREGELDIAFATASSRFRVNGYRQRGTSAFVFRRIPGEPPSFGDLSLPRGVRRLAEAHHGLILVTGPTGSGKSTTLASMINHINCTRPAHIVTIEDPIEILHRDRSSSVSQREVGLDTRSFSEALRRALRQDPDVVLIGEIREVEAAETALHAAESGHLVLSTLHTVNAAETISRLVDLFPAVKQAQVRAILAGVLRGVISQRLLPRRDRGVVAAVEVMVANARIAELIRENRPDEITDAIAEGSYFDMQTFEQALVDLVLEGAVDREVAANAAMNRHDFLVTLEHELKAKAVRDDAPETEAAEDDSPAAEEPEPLAPLNAAPWLSSR